jgi:hypothetical protein
MDRLAGAVVNSSNVDFNEGFSDVYAGRLADGMVNRQVQPLSQTASLELTCERQDMTMIGRWKQRFVDMLLNPGDCPGLRPAASQLPGRSE